MPPARFHPVALCTPSTQKLRNEVEGGTARARDLEEKIADLEKKMQQHKEEVGAALGTLTWACS
jgi:hypothetical protein